MKTNNNRSHKISLRLTPEEYARIDKKSKTSLCRHLSVYVRNILFNRPIVTIYRNRSMDDLMEEVIRLRKELNALQNSFTQTLEKLPAPHQNVEFDRWLTNYEIDKEVLFNKIDEIKSHFHKMTESWLQ